MFGLGILKGLGVTLKHFVNTFVDDLRYFPGSTRNEEAFAQRQSPTGAGLFTVEYPEMKLNIPENFRFIPFLITDYDVPQENPDFDREEWLEQNRCTSCGICAKVCPPQCIWIVRTNDPDTGKPIPQPAEFYIDIDICMNCGYCAEFCPFDAIKMDHDYELADYTREEAHIHDLERLLKPVSYYAAIRPSWHTQEVEARREAEEEKKRKEEERKRKAAEKAEAKKAKEEAKKKEAEEAESDDDQAQDEAKSKKRSPEEIKAQREAMLAKRQKKEAEKAESSSGGNGTGAQAESTEEKKAASSKPDDLTKIEGIGPKISKLLQAADITTFAQLAETKVERLQEILKEAQLRIADPTTWPEQAQLAADQKWDELDKLQDELKGGRRVEK